MPDMKAQLEADLAMRDQAKLLVTNGLRHVRGDVEEKGVAARASIRMREGAEGLLGDSTQLVRDNPARIGSGIGLGLGLVFAWFFRDEIASLVEKHWPQIEEFAEQIADSDD